MVKTAVTTMGSFLCRNRLIFYIEYDKQEVGLFHLNSTVREPLQAGEVTSAEVEEVAGKRRKNKYRWRGQLSFCFTESALGTKFPWNGLA